MDAQHPAQVGVGFIDGEFSPLPELKVLRSSLRTAAPEH